MGDTSLSGEMNEILKEKLDHPVRIQKLNILIYNELEACVAKKSGRIARTTIDAVKEVMDKINELNIQNYKELVVAKTKAEMREEMAVMLKRISEDIADMKERERREVR